MTTTPAASEIFISYSRRDNVPSEPDGPGWVTALRNEILEDHRRFSTEPLRIFFDTSDIQGMDDWRHRILEGLRHSKILLVCLSPNYFKSDYCRWEWEEYHRRQVHQLIGHDSIAPVYFVEVSGSDEYENAAQVEKWLAEIKRANYAADLRPWFPRGVTALRDEAVRLRISELGNTLWERIQRARRAGGVPGNLRRMNPYFVGRKRELRELHEQLNLGAVGVVTAVHGLGGQGKTQLATAYAHGWADCYPAGLWALSADRKTELLPLLGQLVDELELPASLGAEETAADRGRRVLRELKRQAQDVRQRDPDGGAACLVLLDNVTQAHLLAEPQLAELPRENWLRVVATTRMGQDQLTASPKSLAFVPVDKLLPEDALELIRDHQPVRDAAGQPVLNPTPDQLAQPRRFADSEQEAAARDIVRELDGFTLAVEAVALFLGLHPEIAPAAYLSRLRREGLVGADSLGAESDIAAQTQHRQTQLPVVLDNMLAGLNSASRTALDYAALLPPDSVVWARLQVLVVRDHPDMEHEQGYPDPWPGVRRRLEGLRLITPGDHPQIGRLHRLVAAHLTARMTEMQLAELTERVDQVLEEEANYFEQRWRHNPSVLRLLRPLQEAVLHLTDQTTTKLYLARIAGIVGAVEREIGRFDDCLAFFELAQRIAKAAHDSDPESEQTMCLLSSTLWAFGDVYMTRGWPGDARRALETLKESLRIRRALSEVNPNSSWAARDVSVSLERLGDFYLARGQPGDAETALTQFEEAHRISKDLYEANPNSAEAARDFSVSLLKLGDAYLTRRQSHDLERAIAQFEDSLRIRLQLYEANPNSAQAVRDVNVLLVRLGDMYLAVGDAERARAHFHESLQIADRLYQANPDATRAARDLLLSLERMADITAADQLSESLVKALTLQRKALQIATKLLMQNPGSVFFGRTAAITYFKTAQRAEMAGHQSLAHQCGAGCHSILHELVTAGYELDEDMRGLYEELHPMFEKE